MVSRVGIVSIVIVIVVYGNNLNGLFSVGIAVTLTVVIRSTACLVVRSTGLIVRCCIVVLRSVWISVVILKVVEKFVI